MVTSRYRGVNMMVLAMRNKLGLLGFISHEHYQHIS